MLVSDMSLLLHENYADCEKKRYYPIPKRSIPDDIRRKIDRVKEKSRVKQTEKIEN
jgi:hypothetical protein